MNLFVSIAGYAGHPSTEEVGYRSLGNQVGEHQHYYVLHSSYLWMQGSKELEICCVLTVSEGLEICCVSIPEGLEICCVLTVSEGLEICCVCCVEANTRSIMEVHLLVCNEPNRGMVLVAVMLLLFTAISAKGLQQVHVSFCFTSGMSGTISPWCKGWSQSEACCQSEACSQTAFNICAV